MEWEYFNYEGRTINVNYDRKGRMDQQHVVEAGQGAHGGDPKHVVQAGEGQNGQESH